ncbi:F-box/RNI-like/FBD-like domains-containing protein [Rhynchospora pubera]|uniref:F-box/RNI-like/FBD-like domains-containing protein n=1 Tax=Rhynchospora pubera TaxID=906938 RepID=A0AAV8HM26_9POAL|nr:F-box/RNI-like/FBD-like domains-containing protein [Rhynchospora pubera]
MLPSSRRSRVGAPSDSDSDSDPQTYHLPLPPPDHNPIEIPDQNQNPDQDRTDLISHLPDCVLSTIISLLPIRDSIRTGILSSRFRHLWKQNPLHLDDSTIPRSLRYTTSQVVTCIATVHPGPIHSARISQFDLDFRPKLDDLIETLTRKGTKELSLGFGYKGVRRYRLPLSLLQCQTLRKVSLSDCFFPPSPFVDSSFPNLRELTLEFVFLWDDLLHCLLKSCTHLEVLQLMNCAGLQYLHINCAKLQKLTIHEEGYGTHAKEVVIENAPELRSLRLGEFTVEYTRISVQHVKKLEVLGFFSMNATMRIGNTFTKIYNQHVMSVNGSMGLPTVKKLAILVDFGNGSQCSLLPSVLRCFPCLERLDIKCIRSIGPGPDEGFWEQQAPFGFFEHHLRYVTMINFSELSAEMQFLKFLIHHGRVLERITFVCPHKLTDTWQKTMRRELSLLNCASINPEVVFLRESDSCEWVPLFYRLPGA